MTDLTGPAAELIITRRESLSFETKRVSGKMVGKALAIPFPMEKGE